MERQRSPFHGFPSLGAALPRIVFVVILAFSLSPLVKANLWVSRVNLAAGTKSHQGIYRYDFSH